jgi:hypothetical protein
VSADELQQRQDPARALDPRVCTSFLIHWDI